MNRQKSGRGSALRVTAIHEAGHAVFAWFSPFYKAVHGIIIRRNSGDLGRTFDERRGGSTDKNSLLDEVACYLAGMVAEELSGHGRTSSNDLPEATVKALEMVREFGMGRRVGLRYVHDQAVLSPWLKSSIDRDVREILGQAYRRARRVIAKHLDQVEAIAEVLLRNKAIDQKSLERILGPKV